ncbi:MAG: UbiA family prenyltransferase [Planctomycetota bacterium]
MTRILRYRLSPILATIGLSCLTIQVLSSVEAAVSVVVAIGSATWIIYPLDPILDPRDRNPGEGIRSWTSIRLLIALVVFVMAVMDLREETIWMASVGLPLAVLYAIPLQGKRLKDRSITKIPFISLAVTTACVGIPWLQSDGSQCLQIILLFMAMLVLVATNVIVCDLRDRVQDQLAGLKTLAIEKPAIALKLIRGLFMVICLLASAIVVTDPNAMRMGQGFGLLLATITLNIAASRNQQPILMTLLADGSLALPAICGAFAAG